MKMNVLKKNDKWNVHYDKFQEEAEEVTGAMLELMLLPTAPKALHEIKKIAVIENLVEETFDVMQMCIGILEKLVTEEKIDLEFEANKHNEKLKKRGWVFEKEIKISIK